MAKLAYQVALLTKQVVYSVYQVADSSRQVAEGQVAGGQETDVTVHLNRYVT